METQIALEWTEAELQQLILDRLSFKELLPHLRHTDKGTFEREHLRFEMSGYESQTGACTVSNMAIINRFADLGIYNYTDYLFLDFYKGSGTLYLRYFGENENLEFDLSGLGTTEILMKIFGLTILSGKDQRRRI